MVPMNGIIIMIILMMDDDGIMMGCNIVWIPIWDIQWDYVMGL